MAGVLTIYSENYFAITIDDSYRDIKSAFVTVEIAIKFLSSIGKLSVSYLNYRLGVQRVTVSVRIQYFDYQSYFILIKADYFHASLNQHLKSFRFAAFRLSL